MPRRRVHAVVREHRVVRHGGEADAVAVQDGAVELDVVRDEGLGRVGEEVAERVDLVGGDVPRLAGPDGEREADELAEVRFGGVVAVERGGFGVLTV